MFVASPVITAQEASKTKVAVQKDVEKPKKQRNRLPNVGTAAARQLGHEATRSRETGPVLREEAAARRRAPRGSFALWRRTDERGSEEQLEHGVRQYKRNRLPLEGCERRPRTHAS